MNFIKSLFHKTNPIQVPTQIIKPSIDTSILDPNYTQVKLKDIKNLVKNQKNLDQVLNSVPETINDQLKILYSIHMLMSSGQIQTIDKVVNCFDQKQVRQQTQPPLKNYTAAQTNQTHNYFSEQQANPTFQNSMYLNVSDQISEYEKVSQNETELTNLYYNYIQRITNNSEIYNSCKYSQYPFPEESQLRKMQFLWLFKITNLMNFKLSLMKQLEMAFKFKTANTPIIRDIAYLIYKDCLSEYNFLRAEITDMLDSYSQFQVKEVLQFYELFLHIKAITAQMKHFHAMRLNFTLNSASVRDVRWFDVEKRQELEIEHYISKAKLLNSSQFKKSLMVPNQKTIIENLHKCLNQATINTNGNESDIKKTNNQETVTTKNAYKKQIVLFSPMQKRKMSREDSPNSISKQQ